MSDSKEEGDLFWSLFSKKLMIRDGLLLLKKGTLGEAIRFCLWPFFLCENKMLGPLSFL